MTDQVKVRIWYC